ncbi:MAG: hypothetical protein HC820_03740, partial [Hydrococcus sp. RM1_1_31]|nr:hypothetical protein [Hydrococcus sp. RM1_1_31]
SQPEQANIEVDRSAYDTQIQQADVVEAVQLQEEFQAVEIQNYLNINLYGNNPPPEEIAVSLSKLSQVTGKQSALIYVSAVENEIVTFTVFRMREMLLATLKIENRKISWRRMGC